MGNWWDFFKPELASEYPSVDGPLTLHSYIGGLEQSYENFISKEAKRIKGRSVKAVNGMNGHFTNGTNGHANGVNGHAENPSVSLKDFDFIGFHGPYGKMVQKGTARLTYMDYLANPSAPEFSSVDPSILDMPRSKSLLDKSVEKQFVSLSSSTYKTKVWPSTQCLRRLGNMYTGAVYGALASIVDSVEPEELKNKRIALFSFGSGLAASFFTVKVVGDTKMIKETMNLKERLSQIEVRPCQEFIDALKLREEKHNIRNYEPTGTPERLVKGTYYLERVDEMSRRYYSVKA